MLSVGSDKLGRRSDNAPAPVCRRYILPTARLRIYPRLDRIETWGVCQKPTNQRSPVPGAYSVGRADPCRHKCDPETAKSKLRKLRAQGNG